MGAMRRAQQSPPSGEFAAITFCIIILIAAYFDLIFWGFIIGFGTIILIVVYGGALDETEKKRRKQKR